ncbi:MaoC/PaaZ C-terminal domain-containing protein [Paraburkholderia susongensis]|uniref:Acyl dehydratase n=1 Tax=Paraburkholderia susongensis TaxID=1515439 RepID=A0A1X7I1S7_9BURK|nr:MaoC/PaaZ C-terminal domain-containing protein [Paraburkholderia susongensis]SMG08312.1 Acyl dehydratase [Paraburkholderia susongensis]
MNGTHLLHARIGDTFALSLPAVTTTQLVRYAGASDDYNRIHYDQGYAREAGLGGVIAHGMLTMGFMGRAVSDWAGPAAAIIDIEARFNAPVRPGDVVMVLGTVSDCSPGSDGRRHLRCDIVARVGEKTVASGAAVVAAPRAH